MSSYLLYAVFVIGMFFNTLCLSAETLHFGPVDDNVAFSREGDVLGLSTNLTVDDVVLRNGNSAGSLAITLAKLQDDLVAANQKITELTARIEDQERAFVLGGAKYRNHLINGNFNFFQRASTSSAIGVTAADRWYMDYSGGFSLTQTWGLISRQDGIAAGIHGAFGMVMLAIEGDAASASDFAAYSQRFGEVLNFEDGYVTVSFFARADVDTKIGIDFERYYGSGGSPSHFCGNKEVLFNVTTEFQRFTHTFWVPSADETISFGPTTYNTFHIYAGYGSGGFGGNLESSLDATLHIAQVQLEQGTRATDFEFRSFTDEKRLVEQYYKKRDYPAYHRIAVGVVDNTEVCHVAFDEGIDHVNGLTPTMTFSSLDQFKVLHLTDAYEPTLIESESHKIYPTYSNVKVSAVGSGIVKGNLCTWRRSLEAPASFNVMWEAEYL